MYVYGADIEVTNSYISDLETKAKSAISIANIINEFINNSKTNLVGEVYDAFRTNLDVYSEAYKKLAKLCEILANNMEAANTAFSAYVAGCPDGDPVDMRHIPIYEAQIKQMEARIAELEKVPETIRVQVGENEFGSPIYEEEHNPEWDRAQAEITELQAKIADLKNKIAYIKRLPDEDSSACSKLESITSEINEFVNTVNSLNVSKIS